MICLERLLGFSGIHYHSIEWENVSSIATLCDCLSLRAHDLVSPPCITPSLSALSPNLQLKALRKPCSGCRKVILSTNLAESSVTIEGVGVVIDCGFVRTSAYNGKAGINVLTTVPISQVSAQQRAGRAGRTSPGWYS